MTDINQAVALLNEAVALDPRLWGLFDVMVPCATIVGHATPIELMALNQNVAMASLLGVLNGILADEQQRISIITENEGGRTRRVFIRTSNSPDVASNNGPFVAEAPAEGAGNNSDPE